MGFDSETGHGEGRIETMGTRESLTTSTDPRDALGIDIAIGALRGGGGGGSPKSPAPHRMVNKVLPPITRQPTFFLRVLFRRKVRDRPLATAL